MSGFDRKKFGGSTIASVKQASEEAKKNNVYFGDNLSTTGFFNVKDGKNWFRVAPTADGTTPYVPVRSVFLQCEVDVYKDGEKTGEKEVKNKKLYIATQHSPKMEDGTSIIKADPIELYIRYVFAFADEQFDKDKEGKAKFLSPVNGYRDKKGVWHSGIKPQTDFVCYAFDETGKLGRLTLNQAWMKEMNKISLNKTDDDVMAIDIFSDPDQGFPLIIKKEKEKDKTGKEKTVYDISVEDLKRGEDWNTFYKRVAITDKQLMELSEAKSLQELYVGNYSKRDFDLAIDGLKRFDDEHKYGVFENDDFLTELEAIAESVPEKKEEESKEGKDIEKTFEHKPTSSKKEEPKKETVKTESKKDDEVVPPIMMKKFLNAYILEEYGTDQQLPTLDKDQLKEWYDLAKAGELLPFEDFEQQEESQEPEQQSEPEIKLNKTGAEVSDEKAQAIKDKLSKFRRG